MIQRIMGIDFGLKRIGIAVSDPLGIMAHPVTVITHTHLAEDMARIRAIITEYGVERIVVGQPFNMDGTPGRLTQEFTAFADRLARESGLPVDMIDETLTSHAADELMTHQGGVSRKKRKTVKDKIAAALILESYLARRS